VGKSESGETVKAMTAKTKKAITGPPLCNFLTIRMTGTMMKTPNHQVSKIDSTWPEMKAAGISRNRHTGMARIRRTAAKR
jgi:hypothetical protein